LYRKQQKIISDGGESGYAFRDSEIGSETGQSAFSHPSPNYYSRFPDFFQ